MLTQGLHTSMQLQDILTLSRTSFHANISSKKKMLEYIAQMVSNDNPQIQSHDVFDALIEREKLGSTGIGHGVALPHCRLKMIESAMAVLVLLENSFDYGSLDKQPVDIVVAVLVPEEATEMHLELLSMLAKKLSNPLVREQIRHASDKETLFKFATA